MCSALQSHFGYLHDYYLYSLRVLIARKQFRIDKTVDDSVEYSHPVIQRLRVGCLNALPHAASRCSRRVPG